MVDCWLLKVVEIISYGIVLKVLDLSGGRHQEFIPLSVSERMAKLNVVGYTFAISSPMFVKISICLTLLRLKDNKLWRVFLWCLMIESMITSVVNIFLFLLECRPISLSWNITLRFTSTKCWST